MTVEATSRITGSRSYSEWITSL